MSHAARTQLYDMISGIKDASTEEELEAALTVIATQADGVADQLERSIHSFLGEWKEDHPVTEAIANLHASIALINVMLALSANPKALSPKLIEQEHAKQKARRLKHLQQMLRSYEAAGMGTPETIEGIRAQIAELETAS